MRIKLHLQIIIITIILSSLLGCKNDIKSVSFELTSSEKEYRKDSIIMSNISNFLKNNQSSIVRNYHYLCDTSRIRSLRDYNVNHKMENIYIGIEKNTVRISPIPASFKMSDGPSSEYRIKNDSLGKFASYFIDIDLNKDLEIADYNATLRFMKDSNGIEKLSFKKVITATETYLIEEKLKKNWW